MQEIHCDPPEVWSFLGRPLERHAIQSGCSFERDVGCLDSRLEPANNGERVANCCANDPMLASLAVVLCKSSAMRHFASFHVGLTARWKHVLRLLSDIGSTRAPKR